MSVDDTPAPRSAEYRKLPAIDAVLQQPDAAALLERYGPDLAAATLRTLLAEARTAIALGSPAPHPAQWSHLLAARLAAETESSLQPLINATGIIVHTNLGRAPLSQAARQAMAQVGHGYNNLEYSLEEGARGSRYDHSRRLLCRLTGAEDALVVNNNAAALLLLLSALCQGQEVLISRGQLVEIGGGFRIPDLLRQSGARLVEVGTTNRTHLDDFGQAISAETAAIMRVHSSNFKQVGFVAQPTLGELVQLARVHAHRLGRPLWVFDDLGSGSLLDTSAFGLAREPLVQESVAAGADLVTCSGDKLLGGPQAGLILGRAELLGRLRRYPLLRAVRVDKLTLAALDATLGSYLRGRGLEEIPVWQMVAAPLATLQARAEAWQSRLAAAGLPSQVIVGASAVGGGSLPGETLESRLLALAPARPEQAAARLRRWRQPVICRIQEQQLLFDPRTVLATQDDQLVAALIDCVGAP